MEIELLTAVSTASTLYEELESEFELALIAVRAASTLDDELLRFGFRLEAWLIVIELFTAVRAASMLDDELERFREEV